MIEGYAIKLRMPILFLHISGRLGKVTFRFSPWTFAETAMITLAGGDQLAG
jgi:hypothetical protein